MQKSAKDHFLPDKEFQGDQEVVTMTRNMYGVIKAESRIIKDDNAKAKKKAKPRARRGAGAPGA